ncbi:hypothetical protein CA833_22080 [Novosphingobium sp. KA1]|nr:hypothetical protein CA833_22080 [Novosphingobium sp. KA1]
MPAPHLPYRLRRPPRQGGNGASVRAMALAVTAGVHVAAVAVAALAFGWLQAGGADHPAPPTLVTFDVHAPDPARRQPRAPAARPRQVPGAPPAAMALPLPAHTAALIRPPAGEQPAPAASGGMADGLPDLALSYRRALMARLEGQRRYPAAALRQQAQGTGSLLFRIDREGRLLGAAIVSGTGHAALDQAALDIVSRAAPFPPIPAGLPDELAVTLPLAFLIDDGQVEP